MAKDRIVGAILASDGKTYREGDEQALQEHLDTLKADVRQRSVDHMAKAGAIEGFGAKAEAAPEGSAAPAPRTRKK